MPKDAINASNKFLFSIIEASLYQSSLFFKRKAERRQRRKSPAAHTYQKHTQNNRQKTMKTTILLSRTPIRAHIVAKKYKK